MNEIYFCTGGLLAEIVRLSPLPECRSQPSSVPATGSSYYRVAGLGQTLNVAVPLIEATAERGRSLDCKPLGNLSVGLLSRASGSLYQGGEGTELNGVYLPDRHLQQ